MLASQAFFDAVEQFDNLRPFVITRQGYRKLANFFDVDALHRLPNRVVLDELLECVALQGVIEIVTGDASETDSLAVSCVMFARSSVEELLRLCL